MCPSSPRHRSRSPESRLGKLAQLLREAGVRGTDDHVEPLPRIDLAVQQAPQLGRAGSRQRARRDVLLVLCCVGSVLCWQCAGSVLVALVVCW